MLIGTRRQGRNRARKTGYRGREENPWPYWLKIEQIYAKKYLRKVFVQNHFKKRKKNDKGEYVERVKGN